MNSIISWRGGKSRQAKIIIQILETIEHSCYVEPFMGAAHVFFRKVPVKSEVLNDINSELANLFRVVQNHLRAFVECFRFTLVSREEFERLKKQRADTLTDIQRAVRFYYLQKCAFGGIAKSPTFGTNTVSPPRFNLTNIKEVLTAAHLRLARVNIENLLWHELIKRYDRPHTLFYVDPPYWGHEDDYGKNLFPTSDYQHLADTLATINGNFLLSINDTPETRKLFYKFNKRKINVLYSAEKANPAEHQELLISNCKV